MELQNSSNNTKKLIVVYKENDEIALNQLCKLIEKQNAECRKNGEAENGCISVIKWTEKYWQNKSKAGNINGKILFIGIIKGTNNVFPIIDVKYKHHGILYGWAGKQAFIRGNPKFIKKERDYYRFLQALLRNVDGEITQKHKKVGANSSTAIKFGGTILLAKWWPIFGTALLLDVFSDKCLVREQQLVYGVTEFCNRHLSEFVNE